MKKGYLSKLGLLLGLFLNLSLSHAGVPSPLQNSIFPLQAAIRELPDQTKFSDEVSSIQNKMDNRVEVLFKNGCRHLYDVEYSMSPTGVITDIQAVLLEKISCEGNATTFGGVCCSKLPDNATGCDPQC